MSNEVREALAKLPDYVPMDHEAMTSIDLPGDVISDTKARQQYARAVERKAVDYYRAQLRAALAASPQVEPVARDRKADRARFPDPAFNRWLDEGISDAGHTVWDQVGSVVDAWHGWNNRPFYASPKPAQAEPQSLLEWACWRWREEVQDRPLVNKNRRPLDDAWRQVIRFAGGDPDALVGPSHDALLAAAAPNRTEG